MTCTFDSNGQLTLMACTGTGDSARNNFRSLRQISSQLRHIFIIDLFNFVDTELANFFAAFSAMTAT